jgi:hypothetical protein
MGLEPVRISQTARLLDDDDNEDGGGGAAASSNFDDG